MESKEIDEMLLRNEVLIRRIIQEGNTRKNKNLLNSSMASLINDLERNLITLCRNQPPEVMGDPQVMEVQRASFEKMCKRRTTQPAQNTNPSEPK